MIFDLFLPTPDLAIPNFNDGSQVYHAWEGAYKAGTPSLPGQASQSKVLGFGVEGFQRRSGFYETFQVFLGF